MDAVGRSCAHIFFTDVRELLPDGSSGYSGQFSLLRTNADDRMSFVDDPGLSDRRGWPEKLPLERELVPAALEDEDDRSPSPIED